MASMRDAIADKCKDCIYDPLAGGTWREQVELCTSEKSCALWPYRPITAETLRKKRVANKLAEEADDT